MPNVTERFLAGVGSSWTLGMNKDSGLPNIKGSFLLGGYYGSAYPLHSNSSYTGAFSATSSKTMSVHTLNTTENAHSKEHETSTTFNASLYNSIYGTSSVVRPPLLAINYVIKY